MANEQHIQWLLEGVEAWNARREVDDFVPDFEDANLDLAFYHAGKIDDAGMIPLDDVDFRSANLTGANLYKASLAGAKLGMSNGQGLDLTFADLKGANLAFADLTKAKLHGANLAKAYLVGANLTETVLLYANLDDAVLMNATLRSTFFYTDASLTNTNFINAKPWRAKLYGGIMKQSENTTKTTRSIEDLLPIIRDFKNYHNNYNEEVHLYFRGEARCCFQLTPSIMRGVQKPVLPASLNNNSETLFDNADVYTELDKARYVSEFAGWFESGANDNTLRASERDMLIDIMASRPEEFSSMSSALAKWVLAQHHGLKTRFLDITKNLLVGLYFACEKERRYDGRLHVFVAPKSLVKSFNSDAISVVANFARLDQRNKNILLGKRARADEQRVSFDDHRVAMRQLRQLIREEKPYFEERIDPRDFFRVFIVEPQQLSERIRAQSGAFLVSAFHERFERAVIEDRVNGIPVYAHYTLTIPHDCKDAIMEDLRLLNITRETLFPGLDPSAAAITKRYETGAAN